MYVELQLIYIMWFSLWQTLLGFFVVGFCVVFFFFLLLLVKSNGSIGTQKRMHCFYAEPGSNPVLLLRWIKKSSSSFVSPALILGVTATTRSRFLSCYQKQVVYIGIVRIINVKHKFVCVTVCKFYFGRKLSCPLLKTKQPNKNKTKTHKWTNKPQTRTSKFNLLIIIVI